MKIEVTEPTIKIGNYERPDNHNSLVAVKVTTPCQYCNQPVTYIRGGVFSGDKYHWACYQESGDAARDAEAFQKSVCGDLTPDEYQRKHGVAWNE